MPSKFWDKKIQNRIIYTVCFFLFVVIDQRTKTLPSREGWLFMWQNALGIVVGLLIMTHYKWGDVKKYKLVYGLWSVLGVLAGAWYYLWKAKQSVFFANATIVLIVDVLLFGYIVIHICIDIFVEKKVLCVKKCFLYVWTVMMLLMIFSRSEYIWPLGYLVIFGCFYLTDFSKEEVHDMILYGCKGIVLAFLVIQGLAFVFRPYEKARYIGMYTNTNQNALFYVIVLVAVLINCMWFKRQEKKIGYYFYILGICVLLSFILLTIGRTAICTTIILVFVFLKNMCEKIRNRKFWKWCLGLSLGTIMMFPICFALVRYIPTVFHHPIWFDGEWNENKIHSWEAWNSEKYVEIDEYMEVAFGRINETVTNLMKNSPFKINVNAAEKDPKGDAILSRNEGRDSVLLRKVIYKYYFENLNWRGYPYCEQGVQASVDYRTYHAHNIYLQYGTDFGIPVMIIFIILIVWGCAIYAKRIKKNTQIEDIAMLMFILVPALYGILEYSWGISSMSITMLFIAWRIPEWKN